MLTKYLYVLGFFFYCELLAYVLPQESNPHGWHKLYVEWQMAESRRTFHF